MEYGLVIKMRLNKIILEQKFDEIIDMLNRVVCFTDNEREAKERVINMTKELKKEFISNFNVTNVTKKFLTRDSIKILKSLKGKNND